MFDVGGDWVVTGSRQLRVYLFMRQRGDSIESAAEESGIGLAEARLTEAAIARGELAEVEPLDPMIGHNKPPEDTMSGTVATDELRLLIERVERLEDEKKGISDDIKDVYGEAKARGYDPTTMRRLVRLRKMEKNARDEAQALLETYAAAVGLQGVLL